MRILIDIGHPAHVHYFRNLANELKTKGHNVIFTVKDATSAKVLLDRYDFQYIVLPAKSDKLILKFFNQIRYDLIVLNICRRNKIDIAIGVSLTITHLSLLSGVRSIAFDDDDDDVQPLFVKWGQPFATELISPDVLRGKQKRKDVIYYPGYHELAYLHPKRFSPDVKILSEIGLKNGEKFFILRFNAFKAHHDVGVNGLSEVQKKNLVEILSKKGKVFISAERELEKEFECYRINLKPEKMHHLIYFSTMFLGDSQTMTSEAAVLGTPSIRCNSLAGKISYLEEEEYRYGLTFGFRPEQFDSLVIKVKELLEIPDLKEEWIKKRDIMLKDKIDVTAFWLWFIENYPQSKKEYLLNHDIFNQFK